jgi:hypothetical protein
MMLIGHAVTVWSSMCSMKPSCSCCLTVPRWPTHSGKQGPQVGQVRQTTTLKCCHDVCRSPLQDYYGTGRKLLTPQASTAAGSATTTEAIVEPLQPAAQPNVSGAQQGKPEGLPADPSRHGFKPSKGRPLACKAGGPCPYQPRPRMYRMTVVHDHPPPRCPCALQECGARILGARLTCVCVLLYACCVEATGSPGGFYQGPWA